MGLTLLKVGRVEQELGGIELLGRIEGWSSLHALLNYKFTSFLLSNFGLLILVFSSHSVPGLLDSEWGETLVVLLLRNLLGDLFV